MITVESLTRRFGSFTAVDDISFRLERGDVARWSADVDPGLRLG